MGQFVLELDGVGVSWSELRRYCTRRHLAQCNLDTHRICLVVLKFFFNHQILYVLRYLPRKDRIT